ncbi:MAG: isopeptide-forming domain-containing fimbrial protein [Clostridiales Family XIII bacterium]|jgi:fimbrial isopeptide formation D2 family protein|nr:isopeptide-forming domain-containing fimbrial protein [Clostridiales Family XIII bacterium]
MKKKKAKHNNRRARLFKLVKMGKLAVSAIIVIALAFPMQAFALDSSDTKPAARGKAGQSSFLGHKGSYSSWSDIDSALLVDPDYAHKPFGAYSDGSGNVHSPVYGAFGESASQQAGFDNAVSYSEQLEGDDKEQSSETYWGFNVKNGKDAGTFGVTVDGAHIWESGKADPIAIDIRITVTSYTVLGSPLYAYIAIQKNQLHPNVVLVGVKEAELTYQYFLHGTTTAYNLKTNLTYSDVDDHQYVAVGASHLQGIYLDAKTELNYGYTGGKNMFFADTDPVSNTGAIHAVGFAFSSGSSGFTLTFGNNESDNYVDYAFFDGAMYGMFKTDVSDPWKDVSDSDEAHVDRNSLTDVNEAFTYRVYQDVPSGMAPGSEYTSFVMQDQVDSCLEITSVIVRNTIGGTTQVRGQWTKANGVTNNEWFDISVSQGNLVTASAKASALLDEGFYGGPNRRDSRKTLQINVRWNPAVTDAVRAAHGHAIYGVGPLNPSAQDGWRVTNSGTVVINDVPKNTGTVVTEVYKPHKEVSDSDENLSLSIITSNATEPFMFTVSQYATANASGSIRYSSFVFADQVEECLAVEEVKVYQDGLSTDVSGSFDITSTNDVRASAKASALQSAAFYGHEYTVMIKARFRTDVNEATLRAHGHYTDSDRSLLYMNQGTVSVNGRPSVQTNIVGVKARVPDLSIEKTVTPYENQVGDAFRYTVKVKHTATSAGEAANVRIWDCDLPVNVSISGITVSGLSTQGKSIAEAKGGFEMRADVIKLSETAVISFDVSAPKELNGTIITNTALVSSFSDTSGDWTAPKSDSAEVYINSPKLNVEKTAQTDGGKIEKGDEIHYKAVITNINRGTFMRDCIFFDEITQAGVELIPGSITVRNSQNKLLTNRCDITVSGNAFTIEPEAPLNIAYEDMVVPPKELGRKQGFQSVAADYAGLALENRVTVTYSVNISNPDLIEGDIVNIFVSPSRPNTNGDVIKDDPDIPSGGDEDEHVTQLYREPPEDLEPPEKLTPPEETEPPDEKLTPPPNVPPVQIVPPVPAPGPFTSVTQTVSVENEDTVEQADDEYKEITKGGNKRPVSGVPRTGDSFKPMSIALIMACAGALTLFMLLRRRVR